MCACHTVCLLSRGLSVCQHLCVCVVSGVGVVVAIAAVCAFVLCGGCLEEPRFGKKTPHPEEVQGDGGAVQARGGGVVQCSQCMQCLCFVCSTAIPPTRVGACQLPSLAVFTRRRIHCLECRHNL
jgi:hypothetical protein